MRVASNLFILMALCLEERFKVTFYNFLLVFVVLHLRLGFMFYIYFFFRNTEAMLPRHRIAVCSSTKVIPDKASVHTQDGAKPGRAGLEIGASHIG